MQDTVRRHDRPWRVRAAVVGVFFLLGFCLAVWAVSIPSVQQDIDVSNAVLGLLLLAIGAGSVVGMQVAGPFVDRYGSKSVISIGVGVLAIGIALPGFLHAPAPLAVALFVYGLGNGVVEVTVNDQAVHVERRWGKPIMGGFHAFFAVGSAVGSATGALLAKQGLPAAWTLSVGAIVAVLLGAACIPMLDGKRSAGHDAVVSPSTARETRAISRRVVWLAVLAFLMMLAEGTANDWSALQASERFNASASAAAIAYGVFAISISAGRFASDVIVHAVGSKAVVRYGALVAGIGMLVVVLSPLYGLTLVGWANFGIGLSGMTPQIFSAAGNLGARDQAVVISRVVGSGFVGLLAGPAVIGWIASITGLTYALILPLIFCAIAVVLAPQVAGPRRRTHQDHQPAQDRRVSATNNT
jgi:MFS family permease